MGMFQSQIELDGHDKLKSFTFSSKAAAVCRELKAFMVEFRFDAYGKTGAWIAKAPRRLPERTAMVKAMKKGPPSCLEDR